MTELINSFFAVEVPEDSSQFVIDNGMQYLIFKVPAYENWITDADLMNYAKVKKIAENYKPGSDFKTAGIKLSENKFELIGISDEMSEDACSSIVEMNLDIEYNEWWMNYTDSHTPFKTANESFRSLLKSKSLTKRYCIIKKIK